MFQSELKIPKSRVAVLIGKKGVTKRHIQKFTGTSIKISKEGDVLIEGEDNLHVFITSNIVKAIGRGFNPELAMSLLKDDIGMEIINITDFSGKSKTNLERARARLIGTEGRAWKNFERLSACHLAVQGKTVSIIGHVEALHNVKTAIERLLSGAKHGNVYTFMEKANRRKKFD